MKKIELKPILEKLNNFLSNLKERLTGSWKTTLTGVFALVMFYISRKYNLGESEVEMLNDSFRIIWGDSLKVLAEVAAVVTLILTKENRKQ